MMALSTTDVISSSMAWSFGQLPLPSDLSFLFEGFDTSLIAPEIGLVSFYGAHGNMATGLATHKIRKPLAPKKKRRRRRCHWKTKKKKAKRVARRRFYPNYQTNSSVSREFRMITPPKWKEKVRWPRILSFPIVGVRCCQIDCSCVRVLDRNLPI